MTGQHRRSTLRPGFQCQRSAPWWNSASIQCNATALVRSATLLLSGKTGSLNHHLNAKHCSFLSEIWQNHHPHRPTWISWNRIWYLRWYHVSLQIFHDAIHHNSWSQMSHNMVERSPRALVTIVWATDCHPLAVNYLVWSTGPECFVAWPIWC